MTLEAGTRLGSFEVLSPLGAGGMGEVYRARDTELGREVAIKVLPSSLAHDWKRLARLKREARTLATLNHPGIATLHEIGDANGTAFLVMELVEGPTLTERIRCGTVSPTEALDLGCQIAAALEAAHEKAIIHRDLKPANVKLTQEGRIKLLDFGLAKVTAGGAADSESPTTTTGEGTLTGAVLGTAAYMSPEQARGQELDRRTDVWSFGCVLYEMLAGCRPFQAKTASDTLAAVLTHEPDWAALPEQTPALVRSLLRRCLQKDRDKRLRDIADARIEIEEALAAPEAGAPAPESPPATPAARRRSAWWALGGLLAGAVIASLVLWQTMRPSPQVSRTPLRLSIVPPREAPILASLDYGVLALSPDGTHLVYVARAGGRRQLYLRRLNQLEAKPIPGTENALTPFFSPDGEWVGFWESSSGTIRKVSLQGGQPVTLCEGHNRGASWGPDNTIYFQTSSDSGLWRVSASGGTPQQVTSPAHAQGVLGHRWPQVLPGGRAALFTIQAQSGRHDEGRIAVLLLETREWRVLIEGASLARYMPSGHIIYSRYGSVFAVPFDLQRLEVTGEPTPVLQNVAMASNGSAYLAVSRTGSLAYVPRPSAPRKLSLVWVDRQGTIEPVTEERHAFFAVNLSPDESRVALCLLRNDGRDNWIYDLRRRTWTRLTFEKDNGGAVWSPDSQRLIFESNREGPMNLFSIVADGSGSPERLTTSPHFQNVSDWSPDGRFVLFGQVGGGAQGIWVLPFEEGREARPYVATSFNENGASFSPDGRWVAYHSNESGEFAVYVRPFPDTGQKWTVSATPAMWPMWSRDGRELFFESGGRLMAVAVRTGPTFRSEPSRVLFQIDSRLALFRPASDGRFLGTLDDEEEPEPEQIVVIPDFAEELQ